ncbi:tyrosine-protein phosphatase [Nocardia abscessus]|uniref:tyrosine-protein phosphatase n=1 Tax=Nocardia abscessus TaxID=120957 RepID=UPI002B4B2B6F|nr:tyrosine-protein phosphatase [Nocardia abscessus]
MIGQAPPEVIATTLTGGAGLYRAFITAPGANEAFASVLRDIIGSDGAVLFHCTAGKDRTGWTAAVLLTLLGVDRATVTEDYLLSNRYRAARADDPLNGVQQSWLDAAFDQADRTYGSLTPMSGTDCDSTIVRSPPCERVCSAERGVSGVRPLRQSATVTSTTIPA